MIHAYRLASLKVESELELPGLSPWDGPANSEPDVVFRRGSVPEQLEPPRQVETIFQTRGGDEYLLALPGMGRILVRNGREVALDAEPGADPINVAALLTGTIQAVLWHQRGLLPLHAGAVVIGGRAVALAGPAAAGKSTLAAILVRQGYAILADDVSAIDVAGSPPRATVLPGVAQLGLWRDALDLLGIGVGGLTRAFSGKDRFLVDHGDVCRQSCELAAVVVVRRRSGVAAKLERLYGQSAFSALCQSIHTRRLAHALGRDGDIFAKLTQMLSSSVAVWQLSMRDGWPGLQEAAETVAGILREDV
jgi:hypothetical protein